MWLCCMAHILFVYCKSADAQRVQPRAQVLTPRCSLPCTIAMRFIAHQQVLGDSSWVRPPDMDRLIHAPVVLVGMYMCTLRSATANKALVYNTAQHLWGLGSTGQPHTSWYDASN